MCGILGILNLGNERLNIQILEKMSASIAHRGPDDCGYVFFELFGNQRMIKSITVNKQEDFDQFNGILAFGHRRLSIIDLTEAGHQPMQNETGKIWIIFNGEIYNYKELAEELTQKGHSFKSKTDTEVILHAYEEWGAECLQKFNGMWAFALWDKNKRKLFCARDRFGIKPFYYFFNGKKFVFASEIKAILQDIQVKRYPNDERIYDYLVYGYLDHTEETFFKEIYQLRGSHYLTLDIQGEELSLDVHRYWDIEPERQEIKCRFEESFLELFEDSIRLHMRSDVPVGTCLSGGLDSSSIVCIAKRFLNSNVHKTFSSCFENPKYDERYFINKVVQTTQTEAHYVFPKAEDLFEEMNDLIWYQEEPVGSTSIYAQWNVFRLAKQNQVKVILDGQGADELLGGYHPYLGYYLSELLRTFRVLKFMDEYKKIRFLHQYSHLWMIGHLVISLPPQPIVNILRRQGILEKMWLNLNAFPERRVAFHKRKFKNIFFDHLYQSLMYWSLPGLLHYEDRNSMAHSIEARVPFLDYRLAEFVFSLPMDRFIRNGTTKVILREVMEGILPERVRTRRDKMGFVTPEDIWFRTVLKNKIDDILNSKSFAGRGYFNLPKVREYFDAHCKEKINISSTIWRWVNLELWFRKFIDQESNCRL